MSRQALTVHNIGKQYRIGVQQNTHRTIRDALTDLTTGSLRRAARVLRGEAYGATDMTEIIWALREVSFEVYEGEVLGIVGHNGAGKSTLLKILSSITQPDEGEVILYGRVGSLLEVGTGFHPELTGRENIYLNGAILGMSRTEIGRKYDAIVDFSEVERFIDTPVKYYSSGMYMRLAFAVAAFLEPDILVVDEVLAVGDAAFQKKCLRKMDDVARTGRTVLFVSHNLAAVQSLCTRAILLDQGQIIMDAGTDEIITRYLGQTIHDEMITVMLPPQNGTHTGTGLQLTCVDASGKPASQFRLGEPWNIVLDFELFRPVEHVTASVQIISLQSVPLITYESKPHDLQRGRYRVEFPCDVPLRPGHLQFNIRLTGLGRLFYHTDGVGHIHINPVSQPDKQMKAHGQDMLVSARQSYIQALPSHEVTIISEPTSGQA